MADSDNPDLYRCTLCDKKVERRGRDGHLKFSAGNGHGDKGELPGEADDYFVEADTPLETDTDGSKDDEGTDEKAESDGESSDPESGEKDGSKPTSALARLTNFLTTPIKDL